MTETQFNKLLLNLDTRFRSIGVHSCDMPNTLLKAVLRGELLLIIVRRHDCTTWHFIPATDKPLHELFP